MPNLNLVTGATGFIGSHAVRLLLERGERVRAFARNVRLLRDSGLEGRAGLEVFEGDLLDPASLPRALEGVDALFHLAGFISTAPKDRRLIWNLNYSITRNLFEACRVERPDRIVFLGSIFGLGGGSPTPVGEDVVYDLDDCRIEYFRAKRRTELYVQDCLEAGLPIVRAYPCYCYGPGDIHISSSRLLLAFLRRRVPAYIRGGQNALDVRDAARGLVLAMDKGRLGERYILGGANLGYAELFEILSNVTGYPPPRWVISQGIGRTAGRILQAFSKDPFLDEAEAFIMSHYWFYDDSKARKELDHTSRSLSETFRHAVDWLCSRGLAPWPPGWKDVRESK
jgi:dihydroflavonol-4-reductase